jgi:hypothetical protein
MNEYFKFGTNQNEKTPGILIYNYNTITITISYINRNTKIKQTSTVTLDKSYADVSNLLDGPLQSGLNDRVNNKYRGLK